MEAAALRRLKRRNVSITFVVLDEDLCENDMKS